MSREYHLSPRQIAAMSTREFMVKVGGLSEHARWPRAYAAIPLIADTPAAVASVLGSYYGPTADSSPGGDPPE